MVNVRRSLKELVRDNSPLVVAIEVWKRIGIRVNSFSYFLLYGLKGARLGGRVRICGSRYIKIGSSFCCRGDVWIEANSIETDARDSEIVMIGDRVNASDGLHVTGISSVYIGNECLIGSFVLISDHTHGRYLDMGYVEGRDAYLAPKDKKLYSKGSVYIGDRCWIGDGAKILAGSHICAGSVVAANSVVNREFEKPCMIGGMPARVIAEFDSETMTWIRCAH